MLPAEEWLTLDKERLLLSGNKPSSGGRGREKREGGRDKGGREGEREKGRKGEREKVCVRYKEKYIFTE